MIIGCTKQLRDQMKVELNKEANLTRNPLYDWHAHLFMFDRKKHVILINNLTRYNIVLYGLKAKEFKNFGQLAKESIREMFLYEGFKEKVVNRYLNNCGDIILAKTHDRSIISQIHQFLVMITSQIEDFLPNEKHNFIDLNLWSNRYLMVGPLDYHNPIDLLTPKLVKLEEQL